MDLIETAGLLSACAEEEEALFARLGRWAVDETDHEAKLLFAGHAHHHAWHASLLRERTPSVGVALRDEGFDGPLPLDVLDSCVGTLERVVGVYVVVGPARVGDYERALASLRWPSDGPVMRVLGLVLADQRAALAAGGVVVGRLAGFDGVAAAEAGLRRRWGAGWTETDDPSGAGAGSLPA